MSRALLAGLMAVALVLSAAGGVQAQDDATGQSFITPFPAGDTYKMTTLGDTMAEGLLYGLADAMGGDPRLVIAKKHRALAGLFKVDVDEEMKAIDAEMQRDAIHILIVMVGVIDRVHYRPPGSREKDRIRIGTDEWKEEYGARIDKVMKAMKKRSVAVYWVGLPPMRRQENHDDALMMNEIFRERAYLNGMKYVDSAEGFSDEDGNFDAYGPDITGKSRQMRETDGIHFTSVGYRTLASFVEREVKRDLTRAKAERNIPLAGAEVEQKRISAARAAAAAAAAPKAPTPSGVSAVPGGPRPATGTAPAPVWSGSTTITKSETIGDEQADNTRITLRTPGTGGREESVSIDILRPAIPASIIALVTRRETAERSPQIGEPLAVEISGGLTVLSSLSSAVEGAGAGTAGGPRRVSPSQSTAYRLLVKGERLSPKPGRIDDFTWPRPETPLVAEPKAATPTPAKASSPPSGEPGKGGASLPPRKK